MPAPTAPPVIVRATPTLDCLDFSGKTVYNDFRDDLIRDGYAVVKGAVPTEKANEIVDEMQTWLEDFNLGYKRDDPSTIREECLPVMNAKGLMQAYGASHETFTWKVRSEPGVIGAFEKLYGTEDLIVSFDAVNITFPGRKDIGENTAWAHQDQDPERPGFRCVQGFVSLTDSGDEDGGLMILKGGHLVSEEFHKKFGSDPEPLFRWTNEMYMFKEEGLNWLKERGYEWVKVNAKAGDLVLWDSRGPHYNVSPQGSSPRFVVYTCYCPVSIATQEELLLKKKLFENTDGHSHWPMALQPFIKEFVKPMRNGQPDPLNKWAPRNPPQLSERVFKLTGIPYIKSSA
ncbi:hypothetical protein OIO90_001758 [Microbotryomycetes sp. JL221]|nr:hypothetical protein OIO90_001758 [Microbotryomycetes sp. JL221]